MYSNKLALAVKVNGKVLREQGEMVALPFGSEYTLLIKNLNSVRAAVSVWIDGKDVLDGSRVIIDANSALDLERSIEGGNLEQGHRFKFIERTSQIENHRGIRVDDGLIRVEFEFEQQKPVDIWPSTTLRGVGGGPVWYTHETHDMRPYTGLPVASYSCNAVPCTNTAAQNISATDAVGITVAGSVSSQSFQNDFTFIGTGVKTALVLRLVGEIDSVPVRAPITVKTKSQCPTCGAKNPAAAKFCAECGTALMIIS